MPESIVNLTFQIQSQKISSGGVIWAQSWITLTLRIILIRKGFQKPKALSEHCEFVYLAIFSRRSLGPLSLVNCFGNCKGWIYKPNIFFGKILRILEIFLDN